MSMIDIKLYEDPNYRNSTAAYTIENIPVGNIIVLDKELN